MDSYCNEYDDLGVTCYFPQSKPNEYIERKSLAQIKLEENNVSDNEDIVEPNENIIKEGLKMSNIGDYSNFDIEKITTEAKFYEFMKPRESNNNCRNTTAPEEKRFELKKIINGQRTKDTIKIDEDVKMSSYAYKQEVDVNKSCLSSLRDAAFQKELPIAISIDKREIFQRTFTEKQPKLNESKLNAIVIKPNVKDVESISTDKVILRLDEKLDTNENLCQIDVSKSVLNCMSPEIVLENVYKNNVDGLPLHASHENQLNIAAEHSISPFEPSNDYINYSDIKEFHPLYKFNISSTNTNDILNSCDSESMDNKSTDIVKRTKKRNIAMDSIRFLRDKNKKLESDSFKTISNIKLFTPEYFKKLPSNCTEDFQKSTNVNIITDVTIPVHQSIDSTKNITQNEMKSNEDFLMTSHNAETQEFSILNGRDGPKVTKSLDDYRFNSETLPFYEEQQQTDETLKIHNKVLSWLNSDRTSKFSDKRKKIFLEASHFKIRNKKSIHPKSTESVASLNIQTSQPIDDEYIPSLRYKSIYENMNEKRKLVIEKEKLKEDELQKETVTAGVTEKDTLWDLIKDNLDQHIQDKKK